MALTKRYAAHQIRRVDQLEVGDWLDLENDNYANPDMDNVFEFEYGVVTGIERETPNCILVHFEQQGKSIGFPPEHRVILVKYEVQS